MQSRRVSCLAQTGFAAFSKGVQLISGSPYAETEQLSRLWAVSFCWLPPVLTFNCDGDLKKAFNECLGVSNVSPTAAYVQAVTYHHEVYEYTGWRDESRKLFGFSKGGPTDGLHPFIKGSKIGLGYTTDSTALPRGIRQVSICVYY